VRRKLATDAWTVAAKQAQRERFRGPALPELMRLTKPYLNGCVRHEGVTDKVELFSLLQEVVWRSVVRWDGTGSFAYYVKSAIHRRILNARAARWTTKRYVEQLSDPIDGLVGTPREPVVELWREDPRLRVIRKRATPLERMMMDLCAAGFSLPEIGQHCGGTVVQIRRRLRGLSSLCSEVTSGGVRCLSGS
jgi:DNA-directed RNA polymerase specialized sigma24 family protein